MIAVSVFISGLVFATVSLLSRERDARSLFSGAGLSADQPAACLGWHRIECSSERAACNIGAYATPTRAPLCVCSRAARRNRRYRYRDCESFHRLPFMLAERLGQ
jgi:hypothetical protein